MRIAYIQLHKPLNIPGSGSSAKWTASGAEGQHKGQVNAIYRDELGYLFELTKNRVNNYAGFAGFYHVPFAAVEHAAVELTLSDRKKLGLPLTVEELGALSGGFETIREMNEALAKAANDAATGANNKPKKNAKPMA